MAENCKVGEYAYYISSLYGRRGILYKVELESGKIDWCCFSSEDDESTPKCFCMGKIVRP